MKRISFFLVILSVSVLVWATASGVRGAEGDLDTSFEGNGIATNHIAGDNDGGYGVAIQSDGKIVLAE